jgi:hypothetical protein
MADAKGSNSQVVIQEETAFAVDPETPAATKIHFRTCGLRLNRPQIESDTIQGNRNPSAPEQDVDEVSGPLAVELQAYIGLLLKGVLGSVNTTGAGPYVHTFKVGETLPSFVIEKGFTDIDQYFKYNGCKINRMNFSVTPKGFQNVDFDIIGVKETIGSSPFDATPTDLGRTSFTGRMISTIEEGGSAAGNVLSIDSLAIENGLDGDQYYVGGAGLRGAVDEGMVKVSGTLKAKFANLTLLNKALSSTESSLKVIYSKGDGLGSAGNESIEFKVPELKYSVASPIVEGPRGVMVDLAFIGYYTNNSEASALQVILKNAQATI